MANVLHLSHLPIREDGKFTGVVNVVTLKGRNFIGDGKWEERDVPDDVQDDLEPCREALMEAVC